jgi:hypothetical protein
MARGGINVYVARQEGKMAPVGSKANEYGTGSRAEVEAANRSVASGGSVVEAIARITNAGGGTLKVDREDVGRILAVTQFGVMQAKDGTIIVQDTRFGGKKDAVTLIKPNGEQETVKGGQVTVGADGVQSIKFGNGSSFVVQKTRVDVTKNQKDGMFSINLPPNLRGAAFDKEGNVNGWKINPKAIPDKAVRAWVYQHMSKDGTLRFPSESPVAAKLGALLSKAGYARTNIGTINQIFKETQGARYQAGDKAAKAGGAAAFGAAQRIANEQKA